MTLIALLLPYNSSPATDDSNQRQVQVQVWLQLQVGQCLVALIINAKQGQDNAMTMTTLIER